MKKTLILLFSVLHLASFCQDTLTQVEFTIYPLQYKSVRANKMAIHYESINKTGPFLNIQLPLKNKWSLSLGLLFNYIYFEELYPEFSNTIYYIEMQCIYLTMPLNVNFNLYNNEKFYCYLSGGYGQPLWYYMYKKVADFPDMPGEETYGKGLCLIDYEDISLYINLSLKYFPFKRIGVLVYTNTGYNPFQSYTSFNLGFGICYK